MAVLKIETGTENTVLRTVSSPVKKLDKSIKKLLDDMKDTMLHKARGVGLAAPQVGVNIRAIVCLLNGGTKEEMVVEMINPVISGLSEEMNNGEEGCLSLPGQFGDVKRHSSLTVRFMDKKGRENVLRLHEFNARIVQHEIDHLNGILYVDRSEGSANNKSTKNEVLV